MLTIAGIKEIALGGVIIIVSVVLSNFVIYCFIWWFILVVRIMEVTVKSRVSVTSTTLMSDAEVQHQRHCPHLIL